MMVLLNVDYFPTPRRGKTFLPVLTEKRESVMERWHQLLLSEKAASSVEYGLLAAGIAFVVFISIMTLGQTVYDKLYAGAEKLFQ
jgi:Flp pilus assembly pilin Flp